MMIQTLVLSPNHAQFLGKYDQQSNKSQVEVYSSPAELYKLLLDDTKVIKNLRVVTPAEMVEAFFVAASFEI